MFAIMVLNDNATEEIIGDDDKEDDIMDMLDFLDFNMFLFKIFQLGKSLLGIFYKHM